MSNYDALFEDEDDIFGGTPQSKYWDIAGQSDKEVVKHEFDAMIEKIAIMESMLSEQYDYDDLDKVVARYGIEHAEEVDHLKKSIYMDYAGRLIYSLSD